MSTFTGFSEEDLVRMKSGESEQSDDAHQNMKKISLSSFKKRTPLAVPISQQAQLNDSIDEVQFEKCRLSIRTNDQIEDKNLEQTKDTTSIGSGHSDVEKERKDTIDKENNDIQIEFNGTDVNKNTPDVLRGADYSEDELASHRAKLEELQLQQKLMEEQNKKRKEMLAKALADRTRQTEDEVMKLEKIKKELQVLDGQFSQDVAVLRKKIDHACLAYSEAEKHYLKVEKEFLQAKIQLQKEKEKKELLTEHLCALITHNETRKAQKLETLMLELATNKNIDITKHNADDINKNNINNKKSGVDNKVNEEKDEEPIIIDGVDQRTGKIVEFNDN